MLPPHMAGAPAPSSTALDSRSPQAPVDRRSQVPASSTGRQPWGAQREADRPVPVQGLQSRDQPSQTPSSLADQASRSSFSQQPRPAMAQPEASASTIQPTAGVDSQTAEMHSAAEKARLRRLAEEQEREAAAERARQKAKELAERFGTKDAKSSLEAPAAAVPQNAAAVAAKTGPSAGFTLAQRPTSQTDVPTPPSAIPSRPAADQRNAEGSWRSRTDVAALPETRSEQVQPPRAPRTQIVPPAQHPRAPLPSAILAPPPRDAPPHVATPPLEMAELATDVNDSTRNHLSPEKVPRREQNFDSMLARIQAAMAEARSTPEIVSPEIELETVHLAVCPPKPSKEPEEKATLPPPPSIPEFFETTQVEIPKSPPPAWRTYSVKIPKSSATRSAVPLPRVKAFESYRRVPPKSSMMSFEPPIEQLSQTTFSRSDLFLPQPVVRRFAKHLEIGPIVSISPRKLEPYQKKGRKRLSYDTSRSPEDVPSATAAESLLPPNGVSHSAQLRSQAQPQAKPPAAQQPFSNAPGKVIPPPEQPVAERWNTESKGHSVEDQIKKPRSPVKASQAAKAEKQGLFSADGVGIGNVAQRDRALSDAKPGVRFMVSSELEGDSLLDEVNKISLEMVGEGSDEKGVRRDRSEVNGPGAEVSLRMLVWSTQLIPVAQHTSHISKQRNSNIWLITEQQ